MKRRQSDGEMHPYPHLKLTGEVFPRLLATRRLVEDGSEYFGAFLNRTAVRIMIDFLNRTLRLRTCDIPIDGSFDVPCTQYYARRCVAPCVENLCSRTEYASRVHLVRLFLLNERHAFRAEMLSRIEAAADDLDFESAASLRDLLKNVEGFWENPRWQVWLDDTVDTFGFEFRQETLSIFLITQRGRRTIGSHTFQFFADDIDRREHLASVIKMMYRFHAPREIRVPVEFEGRSELATRLSEKFGREIKIKIISEPSLGVTAGRALYKSSHELTLSEIASNEPRSVTAERLKKIFGLEALPRRVEAYDVAHISSTNFVAARIVHDIPTGGTSDFEYIGSSAESEPGALAELISRRYAGDDEPRTDLLLVDGGKTQLNAAIAALGSFPNRDFLVISAVKPQGRHSEISHFLTEDGRRIEFAATKAPHRLLLAIRDEVHELANSVHRLTRDMSAFYELAAILPSISEAERQSLIAKLGSIRRITELTNEQVRQVIDPAIADRIINDLKHYRNGNWQPVLPLVVPIRYDEWDGGAEDLRPILTRNRSAK